MSYIPILLTVLVGSLYDLVVDHKISLQHMIHYAVLAMVFCLYTSNSSDQNIEPFFFVPSPNPPRCPNGFYGKPINFEYTWTADRMNQCNQQNNNNVQRQKAYQAFYDKEMNKQPSCYQENYCGCG